MDHQWRHEMETQAGHLIGIMRAHDDEGIGARAQLDSRIQRLFELYSCGSVRDRLPEMVQYLNEARTALTEHAVTNFDNAKKDMADWTGTAADNFFEYLTKVEGGVYQMVDRIDTLLMILNSYATLVQRMRDEVNALVRRTLDGIAEAESNSWETGAAVIGAVIGVVGGMVGGIGGPPGAMIGVVAAEMVKGALDVAANKHGADSELGVIVQFVDSGEAMIHLVDGERARIERGMRMLVTAMTDEKKLPVVRPERPFVITAPDFQPGTFGLPKQIQGRHPRPKDTRDLVPEPQRHPDGRFDQSNPNGQPHDRYPEQGPAA